MARGMVKCNKTGQLQVGMSIQCSRREIMEIERPHINQLAKSPTNNYLKSQPFNDFTAFPNHCSGSLDSEY